MVKSTILMKLRELDNNKNRLNKGNEKPQNPQRDNKSLRVFYYRSVIVFVDLHCMKL